MSKLSFDAKRASERLGINYDDLIEKPLEEFKYLARGNKEITEEILQMRY